MANDFTVRIFDQFYNLDLVVNAGEYEIVYSYFDNYTNNSATAKTYTETLFKISNITKIPVLELLQTFQTGTNPDLSRIMTYYLNSVSTKNVLYGVNQVMAPNNNIARNVIGSSPDPANVVWPVPPIPPVVSPVAAFTGTPTLGLSPLTVNFTDQSLNSPTSWAWDFTNDGITDSTLQNPSYTYPSPGTYSVKLTVSNSVGTDTLIKTSYITVQILPVADFTGLPTSGVAPLSVNFTDDSVGDPNTWAWDFTNDGITDSTLQNPSYTYDNPGTYSVKLTVSNYVGTSTEIKTNYIDVLVPPPIADFYGIPATGYAPLTVSFTDTSTNLPTSWAWDFTNDGITDSTLQNPSYTYSVPGTYTVKLTATNAQGSGIETKTNYIVVDSPPPPIADFLASPQTGYSPLSVSFTDLSANSPTSWAWDFTNDGITDSTVQNPSHVYSSPGTYTVKLTATNAWGSDSDTKTDYIVVSAPPPPPTAQFFATPVSGTAPLTVTFTDLSTDGPTGWAWDFTNDGITDSILQNPSYIYSVPGTYTVKLTVTNVWGSGSETKINYIIVLPPPPTAAFSATPTTGLAPLAVTFTDLSTDGPTGWEWDFTNDGITDSTMQNPSYTYSVPGTYTVKLTATNGEGSDAEIKTNYIVVTTPPPVADFSATPTSGYAPLMVTFTDLSTNSPTSWAWDLYNNGTTDSTSENLYYTYSSPGTYSVKLTATNEGGSDTLVKTNYITVEPSPYWFGYADTPVESEYASVATDSSGNSVVWSQNRTAGETYLIKIDIYGNIIWQKKTTSFSTSYQKYVEVDGLGNIYIWGNDYNITSLDSDGVVRWSIDYNSTQLGINLTNGTIDYLKNINGVLYFAASYFPSDPYNPYSYDYFGILDPSGSLTKCGIIDATSLSIESVCPYTEPGKLVLAGTARPPTPGNPDYICLLCVNNDLTSTSWQLQIYPNTVSWGPVYVKYTQSGFLSARTATGISGEKMFIAKIQAGSYQWGYLYGRSPSYPTTFQYEVVMHDAVESAPGFIVAGATNSKELNPSAGLGFEATMIKFDSYGSTIFSNSFTKHIDPPSPFVPYYGGLAYERITLNAGSDVWLLSGRARVGYYGTPIYKAMVYRLPTDGSYLGTNYTDGFGGDTWSYHTTSPWYTTTDPGVFVASDNLFSVAAETLSTTPASTKTFTTTTSVVFRTQKL